MAAPATADTLRLDFDVSMGSVDFLELQPPLFDPNTGDPIPYPNPPINVGSPLAGAFSLTIDMSDGHIGASDMITGIGMSLANTVTMDFPQVFGLTTAIVQAGNLRFLDFVDVVPGHIMMGGAVATATAQWDISATVTALAADPAPQMVSLGLLGVFPIDVIVTIETSAVESDVITASIDFVQGWMINAETALGPGSIITFDMTVHAEGTAHVVPDPAFGGLTALALGGAGAWLRRRRS
jgi:MYXO-CTERM domain-containing protein